MTAPDRIVVLWTPADEDTMPATVAAHTEKSSNFVSGAPRWADGKRIEYIRADLADPAAIRGAALRADEMLRIAAQYIRDHYPDGLIHYDDADCDGYCVADDCEAAAADAIAMIPKEPDREQASET